MTDNGWIKLHRKLLDSPIWANSTPEQKTVLITILLSANHEQKTWDWNGKEFKVEPGQFVTSLQSLQKKCGKKLTPQKLRTSLKRFEKLGFLTIETTSTGSLISIIKWDTYQSDENKNNKQNNKHLTNGQQTLNKRLTTNKNDKECKNVRMKELYPPNFQKFWKAYPKKVGKGAAAKQYKNISSPRPTLKIILEAINKQKQTEQWQNKKYIPNPATWLSQRRWEDETTTSNSCLHRVVPLTPEELEKQAKEILS